MKDKSFNFRLSNITLKTIKDKSQKCGVSRAKLIRIAVELVSEDDVLQYMLDKASKRKTLITL